MVSHSDDPPLAKDGRSSLEDKEAAHPPSKSALKRHMSELQRLAEAISKLKPDELANFDLPESLHESLRVVRKLKSSNARNRQLRHSSKILNSCDDSLLMQLQSYFEGKQKQAQSNNRRHRLIESWRDKLLANPNEGVNELVKQFPNIERQEIRTLARLAAKELSLEKTPIQQRKLFQYLRDNVIL